MPVSGANKIVQRRSLITGKMRAQKVNLRSNGGKRAIVPVFTAENLANNDSAIGRPWMRNTTNERERTERAVVPVSGANYFSNRFFLFFF